MSEVSKTAENIISKLRYFAKLYSINSLFVVGGYCRSIILGDKINDIDIASAHPNQALILCGLFASEILHTTPQFYRRTGTGVIEYEGLKVEFQNQSVNAYMHNEDIRTWMRQKGIRDTPLMNNVYGRDFTINSLILSIKNGEFYDLTGRAAKDMDKGIIDTVLPSSIIVKYNPLVVLRAIRFACKYDFYIESDLRKAMKNQRDRIKKAYSQERISKEIDKILTNNPKKGLEELQRYDLLSLVISEQLQHHLKGD